MAGRLVPFGPFPLPVKNVMLPKCRKIGMSEVRLNTSTFARLYGGTCCGYAPQDASKQCFFGSSPRQPHITLPQEYPNTGARLGMPEYLTKLQ